MRRVTSDPAWAAVGISAVGSVLLPVMAVLFWEPGVVTNVFEGEQSERPTSSRAEISGVPSSPTPSTQRAAEPPGKTPTVEGTESTEFVVIFQDDFADMSPLWPVLENQNGGSLRYSEGAYQIELQSSPTYGAVSTAIPEIASLGDVRVEADVTLGANPVVFGLSCRALDVATNYQFLVSSDGAVVIGRRTAGTFEGLAAGRFTTFHQSGGGSYHIAADCVGGADGVSLLLYINSDKILEAVDNEGVLLKGGVGMSGELITSPGQVWFDNFEVAIPAD